ncbi:hypothetical protein SAMN06265368_1344 [Cohaesibacter gelatinilyticus]|uniref:Uncharacterized protein n=1 Tax=Cohaesibacter gelatinilyticus TaxID=372072 RepID=A0A285NJX1_9HYPH|nr:hypothetical protein SAMN06265368_1344 [Cohaesibacter gelatinilyticus]
MDQVKSECLRKNLQVFFEAEVKTVTGNSTGCLNVVDGAFECRVSDKNMILVKN